MKLLTEDSSENLQEQFPSETTESIKDLFPSLHSMDMTKRAKEHTSKDLQLLLSGRKIRLDCGHCCTVGHNFANTLIIVSLGGGRVETLCHSCY